MKKVTASLFLLVAAVLVVPSVSRGADMPSFSEKMFGNVTVIAYVELYKAKVVSQDKNNFKISFDLYNKQGVQSGIKYGVQLVEENTTGGKIVDENVYSEVLTLRENETVHKEISYTAPEFLKGKYTLWVISKNESALPLGQGIAGEHLVLDGTGENIQVNLPSCYIKVSGDDSKKFTLEQGVDISDSESLALYCDLKSGFQKEVTVTPEISTYNRDLFGKFISQEKLSPVQLKVGDNKGVSFLLPKTNVPQSYDIVIKLLNESGINVADMLTAHYVLRGVSGTIQSARLDKDYYSAGEKAKVSIFWTGPADQFVGARGSATKINEAVVYISIKDDKNQLCTKEGESKTLKEQKDEITSFDVDILKNCLNPQVSVVLKNSSGATLDSLSFNVESKELKPEVKPANKNNNYLPALIAAASVLILLLAAVLKRKKMLSGLGIFLFLFLCLTFPRGQSHAVTFQAGYNGTWNGVVMTPATYAVSIDYPNINIGQQTRITGSVPVLSWCNNGDVIGELSAIFHNTNWIPFLSTKYANTSGTAWSGVETVAGTYTVSFAGRGYGLDGSDLVNNHAGIGWQAAFNLLSYTVSDPAPFGYHDWSDGASCSVGGWAMDDSNRNQSLQVHVYRASGQILTTAMANLPRPDVKAAYGTVGDAYGFNVSLRGTSVDDGLQHYINVYAIDIPGGANNPLLANTGQPLLCTPAPPIITPHCHGAISVADISWPASPGANGYGLNVNPSSQTDFSGSVWGWNIAAGTTSFKLDETLPLPWGLTTLTPGRVYPVRVYYNQTAKYGAETSFTAASCPPTPTVTPACVNVNRTANASWNTFSPYSLYQIRLDTDKNINNGFWYKNVSGTLSNNNIPEGFKTWNFGTPVNDTPFPGYLNPAKYNMQVVYHDVPWSSVAESSWVDFTANSVCNPVCGDGVCNFPENSINCPQDCVCKPLTFNAATSSVSPNPVTKNASYTVKCDYGAAGADSISVTTGSGSCVYANYTGTVANFNCTAGSTPGTFSVSCKVNAGTTSDNCAKTNSLGNLTVSANCGDLLCEGTENNDNCPTDCKPIGFELEKSGDPIVYIDSNLPDTNPRKSSTIKIKVKPNTGFNKNVTLSLDSSTPAVPSMTSNFPKTLTTVTVDKETTFYVNVLNSTTPGTKKLVIKGTSGSGTSLVERTIDVFLKVIDSQYQNK